MPEMDFTKVNFKNMDLAAKDYEDIVKAFDQALDDLVAKLLQQLEENWDGDVEGAKAEFMRFKTKWDNAAATMSTNLVELRGAVQIANQNYQAAEARNKAMWYDG
ncbi:WXG100 family type VII secretion target [Nonomuraea sp. NPDC050202]|uniref:WXG100 family type VII secretion target n=1 Tax=unclassified Nonomuraea TaxID=2593643 RepID=UPI0033D0E146